MLQGPQKLMGWGTQGVPLGFIGEGAVIGEFTVVDIKSEQLIVTS